MFQRTNRYDMLRNTNMKNSKTSLFTFGSTKAVKLDTSKCKLLNKIKEQIREDNEFVSTQKIQGFPLIPLMRWGTPRKSKVSKIVVFDDDKYDSQIGPEMLKVYNYLDEVYRKNLLKESDEEDDEHVDWNEKMPNSEWFMETN